MSLGAVKYQTSKPRQSNETAVYEAIFRQCQGIQNLQATSCLLRILKFYKKQRLITQMKEKLQKAYFFSYII